MFASIARSGAVIQKFYFEKTPSPPLWIWINVSA